MITAAFFILIPIFLAFSYRARGGAINLGNGTTDLTRLIFWAVPVTTVLLFGAIILHTPWYVPFASFIIVFLGICIGHSSEQTPGLKSYLDMASLEGALFVLNLTPFYWYFYHTDAKHDLTGAAPMLSFLGTVFACWLGYNSRLSEKTLSFGGITWCRPAYKIDGKTIAAGSEWEEFFIGMFGYGFPLAFFLCCILN